MVGERPLLDAHLFLPCSFFFLPPPLLLPPVFENSVVSISSSILLMVSFSFSGACCFPIVRPDPSSQSDGPIDVSISVVGTGDLSLDTSTLLAIFVLAASVGKMIGNSSLSLNSF